VPLFRKITPIEARQFDPEHDYVSALEVMRWAGMRWAAGDQVRPGNYDAIIPTLEDGPEQQQVPHYANPGDWIARGDGGEFWPIKPGRFAATYELIEEHGHH
jgi:hypothetical protein